MRSHLIRAAALTAALQFAPAWAAPLPYPATFKIQDIKTPEATIHVRVGGSGPAVVLLIDESTRAHYAKLHAAPGAMQAVVAFVDAK